MARVQDMFCAQWILTRVGEEEAMGVTRAESRAGHHKSTATAQNETEPQAGANAKMREMRSECKECMTLRKCELGTHV